MGKNFVEICNPDKGAFALRKRCEMSKTVIVPIDGSAHSLEALRYAISFVKSTGDQLLLLTVHSSSQLLGENQLREAAALAEQESVSFVKKVRVGNPTMEINFEASSPSVRCIVMGYRGAGSSHHGNMLGSVSNGILQLCPCPITLVPFRP
jgi:nucleotide-binding universal stress UspA family protein